MTTLISNDSSVGCLCVRTMRSGYSGFAVTYWVAGLYFECFWHGSVEPRLAAVQAHFLQNPDRWSAVARSA